MSSDNPPYPYYNGIPYNPSFFTSDSGTGLTEAQAGKLFLKKTVPDTATAIPTFNLGLKILEIPPPGSSDNSAPNTDWVRGQFFSKTGDNNLSGINTFTNTIEADTLESVTITAPTVDVYSTSSKTVNLAKVAKTVNIGTASEALDLPTINIGIANTVISALGKLKTNYIRAPATNGITYINDDATGSGATILGSLSTRTKIAGTLEANIIRTSATNGSLSIATDQTTGGTVNIGTASTVSTVNGTLQANTIAGTANTSTMEIGKSITTGASGTNLGMKLADDLTTGNFQMCTSQTSGTIDIGQQNGRSGNVNIASAQTSGTISIGGNGSTTTLGSSTVNIGSTSSVITANASQIVNNMKVLDGLIVQSVIGNANQVSSYSVTFNHKNLATNTATQCYRLKTTGAFLSQLLELTVSGCNASYGPYTYKCSFVATVLAGVVNTTAFTVLTSYAAGAGSVAISFTYVSGAPPYQLNIFVLTPTATTDQNYVTTLVAYPTSERFEDIIDFAIEAI